MNKHCLMKPPEGSKSTYNGTILSGGWQPILLRDVAALEAAGWTKKPKPKRAPRKERD